MSVQGALEETSWEKNKTTLKLLASWAKGFEDVSKTEFIGWAIGGLGEGEKATGGDIPKAINIVTYVGNVGGNRKNYLAALNTMQQTLEKIKQCRTKGGCNLTEIVGNLNLYKPIKTMKNSLAEKAQTTPSYINNMMNQTITSFNKAIANANNKYSAEMLEKLPIVFSRRASETNLDDFKMGLVPQQSYYEYAVTVSSIYTSLELYEESIPAFKNTFKEMKKCIEIMANAGTWEDMAEKLNTHKAIQHITGTQPNKDLMNKAIDAFNQLVTKIKERSKSKIKK